ncbi:MAG: hypothetical protein AAGD06_31950 [Acidobacteriota bacterium]
MDKDIEHLNLLRIFHYVVGGLGCLFSCIPLVHVAMGLFVATGDFSSNYDPTLTLGPMVGFGWLFVSVGGILFLVGQAVSVAIILSGRFIGQRKNYHYSFVVACVACVVFPLGTVLGVFTIIVLSRDTVRNIYGNEKTSLA